jgi:hypothetical protein
MTLIVPPTGLPTTISYDANGNMALEYAGGARGSERTWWRRSLWDCSLNAVLQSGMRQIWI